MKTKNKNIVARNTGWSHRLTVILVLALFSSGLFSRCANISGAPEGGPKDTLPPRVVRMTPAFNATNLRPNQIVIEFDEYIQLKDQQEQFFTSPFMEVKPTLSSKNRSAIITIDSPLDSATTYVMYLGSSVVDNNEGNPYNGLKYTFSTGPYIDSMFMSGFVSDAFTTDTVKGAYIFFYDARLDTVPDRDSLLFDTWKASAVAKTQSDGGFIFSNLKPIDYRVYALMDNNKNQMYDPGTDEVAFLDTVYNPASMPSFLMWYDSTRMHAVAEPQLFFNSFREIPQRVQNLSSSERKAAQQLILKFSAPDPQISRFDLQGIDPEKIMIEYATAERDSLIYWLDVPAEELPDTIVADIVYERPDSAGDMYWHEQQLRFLWKKPAEEKSKGKDGEEENALAALMNRRKERREEKRRQREEEQAAELSEEARSEEDVVAEILGEDAPAADSVAGDSIPPSQMKFTFADENPVIPGVMPTLSFDLPVTSFDTAGVVLYRREMPAAQTSTPGRRGRAAAAAVPETPAEIKETAIPLKVEQDSMLIRQFRLRADWADGGSYRLLIPAGAIRTIDGELNDTINKEISAARNADMATISLNLVQAAEGYEYIVQVLDETGKTIQKEIAHLTGGGHSIDYISPGKVTLRMIEDRNGNGVWDTGKLAERVQPEVVRWYNAADGSGVIELKANMEFEIDVNLHDIFRPRVHRPKEEADEAAEEAGEESTLSHEGHDHPLDTVEESSEGRSDVRTSEARVVGFELTDPRAEKRARQAAKRLERAERKAARQAEKQKADEEAEVIPGYELNYMKDEAPH